MLKPKQKRKTKTPVRFHRMYHDVVLKADGTIDQKKSRWDKVKYSDGRVIIQVPISMTKDFLDGVKRGSTYECVLARGIKAWAKANPDELPHPFEYVEVTRTAIYVVDAYRNGRPSHAVRYMHGFSSMTKTFDVITKAQFKKRFEGHGFTLTLKPGRKYRAGESKDGGNGKGGSRTHKVSARGARLRAEDAGLIAPGVHA
jgi:hypothetical protein